MSAPSATREALLADIAALLHLHCVILRFDARSVPHHHLCHGPVLPHFDAWLAATPLLLPERTSPLSLDDEPEVAAFFRPLGARRGLGAPIRSGTGAFLGEIWALDREPGGFSRAERRALTLFAADLGRELDLARIEEDDLVALGDRDARYAAVFEALAEGVVVQASTGRILAANRAAEVILRMSTDELRGRTSLDPEWRAIRSDGSPFPGEEHPAMVTLRTGERLTNIVMGVCRGGSSPTWISINSVPLIHPGADAPYGVVVSFTDITALREADERLEATAAHYRRFFEQSVDGLLLVLEDGSIIDANPAASALLGRSVDDLCTAHHRDLIDPSDPSVARYLDMCARTGASRGPLRWRRPDGSILHSEHSTVLLHGDPGESVAVVSFRDAEGERRIERAKRDFLATVSHELRTPLTAIRGALGLLAAGIFGPLSAEGVAIAAAGTENAERLARLVGDLLDSSAMDAGTFTIAPARFSVAALLAESLATTATVLEGAGLTVESPSIAPADEAFGDRFRLQQVLVNLLGNAAKFSPAGTCIEVIAVTADAGLRVEVRDRGPGVAEADRPRLFQRFVQLDASDARRRGGAGLGLAISRAIIDAHGGTIGVDPREGGGSIFWFEIPPAPAGCT